MGTSRLSNYLERPHCEQLVIPMDFLERIAVGRSIVFNRLDLPSFKNSVTMQVFMRCQNFALRDVYRRLP